MKMLRGQQKYIITIAYTEVYGWLFIQSDTKKRELLKNPQKLKKSKKKNLLTENEPLQLAF